MKYNLTSALKQALSSEMKDLWVCQPCRVVNVISNLETLLVDVQPLLNEKFSSGQSIEHDTILNVPVVMLGSSTSMVSIPVHKNDTVLCVFSQRELRSFKEGTGAPTNTDTLRAMDMRDAIAIPGLYTKRTSLNQPSKRNLDHDPLDVVVSHNIGTGAETEIRLKTDGTIQATGDTTVLGNLNVDGEFSCTGNFSCEGTGEFTGDVTIGGISFLSHMHAYTWTEPAGASVTQPPS